MSGWPRLARGSACAVCFFCACGPEALVVDWGCGDLRAGALVITEVHANPDGSDGDAEYIEVFNAEGASVSLSGLTLVAERSDGTSAKRHRLLEGSIGPGDYFVLGKSSASPLPDHLDASYGSALGSLRNSDGSVSLWCGDELIDRVRYAGTSDGRARELDGALHPDHLVNDDAANWCDTPEGTSPLSDGNLGTPGRPNSACTSMPLEGTCMDGESARLARTPGVGEVRITEWMPNPIGSDAEYEWVEILFDSAADLHGFELGPTADALQLATRGSECFPVDAGSRVVFGASPAAAPRVDAELRFSLGNSGARSILAGAHGEVLDRVEYDGAVEGVAWQIDEDGEACLAEAAPSYGDGGVGTPGDANVDCVMQLAAGMCLDQGTARRIEPPVLGDAQITEWMADPEAADNRNGEWVEVRLDSSVDLNGLSLEDAAGGSTTITSEACLRVPAGAHALFVRSLDPQENGSIAAGAFPLSLSLNNREETIALSIDGEILDTVSYTTTHAGAATQVDQAGNVCLASTRYGDGDFGTPGAPNPPCF